MDFAAIIVAAGSGSRAGGGLSKQWRTVAGKPVARWSIEAFYAAGAKTIVAVVPPQEVDTAKALLGDMKGLIFAEGGATRAQSVMSGLRALAWDDEIVMIHDAARPFLGMGHIRSLLEGMEGADGAILALPVADTIKREAGDTIVTASRDGLWRAQTPQAFRISALNVAYAAWSDAEAPTDDAGVIEASGGKVRLVPGDPMLMKLTYPEDFLMAEQLAGSRRIVRTGFGIDAHRFGPGAVVWLGGIRIEHDLGLVGHSDADAGLHALTDAVLGAIAEGDIGQHFPPSNPKWKGASSDQFLLHAVKLAQAKGGKILNADLTLICERPKIGPHRDAMRARIAELLGLPIDRVSVKATTTEGMGFTGREEGLMAQAVVSVETPL